MNLLISHCNTEQARLFGMSVYNTETEQVKWLDLATVPDINPEFDSGFTGLALSGDYIFAALQSRKSGSVLVFNHALEYQFTLQLHGPCDIHAICHLNGYIYYTATSESRLMRHNLSSGSNEPVWQTSEYIHINDIKPVDDELYILSQSSQFSPGSQRGILYNIDQQQPVVDDLHQPHTIFNDAGSLFILNSMSGDCLVRRPGQSNFEPFCQLPGYVRGMTRHGNFYYIGLSASRIFSRKAGIDSLYLGTDENYYYEQKYQSYIAKVDIISGKATLFNYTAFNFEIYDILPLITKPNTLSHADAAALKAQHYRMRLFRLQQRIGRLKNQTAQTSATPDENLTIKSMPVE